MTAAEVGRPRALGSKDELQVVALLIRHGEQGTPLTNDHVADVVSIIVSHVAPPRRLRVPFRGGKPGPKWLPGFRARHRDKLTFSKPIRQESLRFAACSGEVLSSNFAKSEKLMQDNEIDADRIFNFDECGITAGLDISGVSHKKRYISRKLRSAQDAQVAQFAYTDRITLMLAVSATGFVAPCLYVLKGKHIPYKVYAKNGKIMTESPACKLPRGAVLALQSELGGVDAANFNNWARCFVESIRNLTDGNRKVLMIYDGYRSHLSLAVLTFFKANNVIVYALPAHTSGKTQPLDVVVFGAFKSRLNDLLNSLGRQGSKPYDVFYLCALISEAFTESFTVQNIRAGFRRAGIWPLNANKLLSVPLPKATRMVSSQTSQQ